MAVDERSAVPVEVELKLALLDDGADAEHLRSLAPLRRLTQGRASTRELRSVYFDTRELALWRQGIALRLRDTGRGRVQTVKLAAPGTGGLFERAEYETVVRGRSPQLDAVPDAALRARLQLATEGGAQPLLPVVETQVVRSRRHLVVPGGEVEWSLDLGELRSAGGALPIREMELELLSGEPRALFELALELHEHAPCRPAVRSKAELGFDALLERRPEPARAGRVEVEEDASVDRLLSAIFRDCLRQIVTSQPAAEDGADPEGVHQMRVGARRLRTALSLFEELLPAAPAAELAAELRWLGGELGDAREWDVFCEETLGGLRRAGLDDGGFKRLCDEAEEQRVHAHERARAALRSPRYGRLALLAGRWAVGASWRDQPLSEASARIFAPARPEAAARLKRLHRRAAKLGRRIDALPLEDLHRLRIRLKRLRYASEFCEALYGARRARRYVKRLAELQDVLGHLNDAAAAEERLGALLAPVGPPASLAEARAAGFVLGWVTRGARQGLEQLSRSWRRFARAERFWR